ncbi:hypothetical protein GCM10018987_61190 [Streptomyces cremeus]
MRQSAPVERPELERPACERCARDGRTMRHASDPEDRIKAQARIEQCDHKAE